MNSVYVEMIELTCWSREGCSITFGVPSTFYEHLRRGGGGFYCPRGHHLGFGKSDADKVRDELSRANGRLASEQRRAEELQADLRHATNQQRALRGHITRGRKRVAAGKCLACSHRFDDLATHMAKEHPGFGTKTGAQ